MIKWIFHILFSFSGFTRRPCWHVGGSEWGSRCPWPFVWNAGDRRGRTRRTTRCTSWWHGLGRVLPLNQELRLNFCQRNCKVWFRLPNKAIWLFLSFYWPLLKRASFYEAAGVVVKIGLSLKPNHLYQIYPI